MNREDVIALLVPCFRQNYSKYSAHVLESGLSTAAIYLCWACWDTGIVHSNCTPARLAHDLTARYGILSLA